MRRLEIEKIFHVIKSFLIFHITTVRLRIHKQSSSAIIQYIIAFQKLFDFTLTLSKNHNLLRLKHHESTS